MVKVIHVRAPDGVVVVYHDVGHHNSAVLFQQVSVVEQRVLHHLPDRGAECLVAQDFLKSRDQGGTFSLHVCEIDARQERPVGLG